MKKKQLKEHKFSTGAKIGLTIIQLICAGIVVYQLASTLQQFMLYVLF